MLTKALLLVNTQYNPPILEYSFIVLHLKRERKAVIIITQFFYTVMIYGNPHFYFFSLWKCELGRCTVCCVTLSDG